MYFLTLGQDGVMELLKIAPMQMKQLRLQHADQTDVEWITSILLRESFGFGLNVQLKPSERGRAPLLEATSLPGETPI
jgi:hypothetical protein